MKLFHNAKIFTSGKLISGYLTIENGIIKDISSNLPTQQIQNDASEAIDCHGNYVFPGFIDAHVHFRDAEQNYKETIETGSKGALAGGVTSVITMPNTIPPLSTVENLDSYKNLAKSEKLFTNVGFFSGVKTGFKISTVSALSRAGIFGIKVYPGDSPESLPLEWLGGWKQDLIPEEFIAKIDKICSNFKVDELYENWRDLFKIAKNFNLPVLFHPEVPRETAQYEKIWDDGIKIAEIEQVPNPNLYAHSVQHGMYSNELALVEMIISFIRKFYPEPKDAPHVHFVHLSSPEPIEIIEKLLKDSGYPCSIEVTPHHLFLNYDSKFTQEVFGKVLVPLRSPKMQKDLLEYISQGHFDIIGTDHAPHSLEEKTAGFKQSPSGFPSIDFACRILLTEAFKETLSLSQVINGYATLPAEIYDIKNKGKIQPGYDADLTIVKKVEPYRIDPKTMESKQKWTPWENYELIVKIDKVFLAGELAFSEKDGFMDPKGKILAKSR